MVTENEGRAARVLRESQSTCERCTDTTLCPMHMRQVAQVKFAQANHLLKDARLRHPDEVETRQAEANAASEAYFEAVRAEREADNG